MRLTGGIGSISISLGAWRLAIVSFSMMKFFVGSVPSVVAIGQYGASGLSPNTVFVLIWAKVSSIIVPSTSCRQASMSASYVSICGSKLFNVANALLMIAFAANFASGVLLELWLCWVVLVCIRGISRVC